MNEEKLYAVKNDEGKYWDFDFAGFWRRELPGYYTTPSKKKAELVVDGYGGHVVALIEEPEKVVLTKEQAKIVEEARGFYLPATLISQKSGNEEEKELLMKAYVNGYTVAKEKKYNVKVPHSRFYYWKWKDDEIGVGSGEDDGARGVEPYRFTEAEIEHYGLQDCEKEEVED